MHELASDKDYQGKMCMNNQTYDDIERDGIQGCGSKISYVFFISYFILNAIIILDLSIGVFITALIEAKRLRNPIFNIDQLEKFLSIWADYDPDSTGWVHVDQLLFIMFELSSPYGLGKENPNIIDLYPFEFIYKKRIKDNEYLIKAELERIKQSQKNSKNDTYIYPDEVKRVNYNNQIYLINESKGLTIKEARAPLILRDCQF